MNSCAKKVTEGFAFSFFKNRYPTVIRWLVGRVGTIECAILCCKLHISSNELENNKTVCKSCIYYIFSYIPLKSTLMNFLPYTDLNASETTPFKQTKQFRILIQEFTCTVRKNLSSYCLTWNKMPCPR